VRAVLRRAAGNDKKAARGSSTAPFVLDEERYQIAYHNHPLELSRYEYRLLRILIKSPGRVYTREHLMQLAWEEPEMSLERTVDAHIKTIRKKLQEICTDECPIVTHRGIGYSLREPST
jgi:two-component system catabolic regulation response regulator CreB